MSPELKARAPSRRRAKTIEEIEQRRLERILRNRQAAQASREKKRKYVKFLEVSLSKLQGYIEVLQANYQHLYLACDPNALHISGARPLDALNSIKNQMHANIEWSWDNNITDDNTSDHSKIGVDNPTYLGSSQNTTSPISPLNNCSSTTDFSNKYPISSQQITGEVLPQNNLTFESNEDSLYYSYLSRVSSAIPWEKPIKQLDTNYPPIPPNVFQSNS